MPKITLGITGLKNPIGSLLPLALLYGISLGKKNFQVFTVF